MNNDASLKQFHMRRPLGVAAAMLAVAVVCSAAVLLGQIRAFSAQPPRREIVLTQSRPVSAGAASRPGEKAPAPTAAPAGQTAQGGKFVVRDARQTWSTDTDIEIFSVRYDNHGDQVFTVNSAKGDKVLAPGTQQSYDFSLSNPGDRAMDYTMTVEAYYENADGLQMPIQARLSDHTGAYLAGSASQWPDVLALNNVSAEGVLSGGRVVNYRLDWRWPFERGDGAGLSANDAYDTMLGNLALDQDLTLHIVIHTQAVEDENPGRIGGIPKTGDESRLVIWAVIAGASLLALLALLLADGRKKHDR